MKPSPLTLEQLQAYIREHQMIASGDYCLQVLYPASGDPADQAAPYVKVGAWIVVGGATIFGCGWEEDEGLFSLVYNEGRFSMLREPVEVYLPADDEQDGFAKPRFLFGVWLAKVKNCLFRLDADLSYRGDEPGDAWRSLMLPWEYAEVIKQEEKEEKEEKDEAPGREL